MTQFDVHVNPSRQGRAERPFVVVVQVKFFDDIATRICVPLIDERYLRPMPRLNPAFEISRQKCYLHPLEFMTIPIRILRRPIANLEDQRDRITAALDYVFLGI